MVPMVAGPASARFSVGHHQPRSRRRLTLATTRRAQQERGYVVVMFAVLLVPLLLMVGLAVDVGYWYNHASDIQKAADAAALAGVVWLPDAAKAQSYALEAAKRNGYEDGVNSVTITVTRVSGSSRQLRVAISDPSVGSFLFSHLGGRNIGITRSAVAEYVLPVPLGSPNNTFGNDPSTPASTWPNLWGNIHGPGTDTTNGDAFATQCRGSHNCGGISNTSYRPGGYLYAIDVPAGVTNMDVQVYDANLAARSAETVETGDTKYTSTGTITTNWTFYNQDSTALDPNDNPTAASAGICSSGAGSWSLLENASDATYKNKWVSLCKVSGTVTAGRYMLRVATAGTGAGANRYAIRVLSSSSAQARLSGYGDMSIYNNVNAGNATFYLAEVDPAFKGQTFEINMYDPGEVSKFADGSGGDGTIQVISPSGSVAPTCAGTTPSPLSSFGSSATLSPCAFQTASAGTARYNGYWVTLDVPIPANYTCTLGSIPGCWWKIKYVINGQANDTTTWSAAVLGNPVHLIDG
ncbi:MAG: hypothetical protein JWN46_3206 [Acidimicrobiales bacterium]|nr:hypothetical protein [Acidimicrobiales bacterium]